MPRTGPSTAADKSVRCIETVKKLGLLSNIAVYPSVSPDFT